MANKIKDVPAKRPETEPPTIIDENTDPEAAKEKKLERNADRAAHKAAKTEQNYEQENNEFSI